MDGAPATLVVSSTGIHTFHIWMREDGLRLDKILLRINSSSTAPAGAGPPESTNKRRLMCVGDSITAGVGDANLFGYRDHLLSRLGIGSVEFVGTYQSPISDPIFDVDHEGVSGNRTDQVKARLAAALSLHLPKPNPVRSRLLLHIGSNDIKNGIAQATAVNNVADIVNQINAYDPTVDVYVALIIPSPTPATDTLFTAYNAALLAQLTIMQATKLNLYIVDMNAAFKVNPNWVVAYMADTLHPNDAGYDVMAQAWAQAIQLHP